jgi:hypothetical protein
VTSAAGGSETVDVALTVSSPRLTLSSTSASFQAVQGGTASPAVATITLSNTGAGDFSDLGGASLGAIGYGAGGGWLTATLPAGSTTVSLTTDPGARTAGTYTANVPVNSGEGGSGTIAVTLTVTPQPAAPDLVLAPSSVVFGAQVGGGNPGGQSVTIGNAGGGGVAQLGSLSLGSVSYGAGATGWLARALNGSGTAIDLSVTTGSLTAGSYTASFTVGSAAGGTEPVSIRFDVDSANAPAQLALAAQQVDFTAVAGGADPAPRDIAVLNRGSGGLGTVDIGTIVYGAGASGWLDGSSASNTKLTLEPDIGGLAAGSYSALVPVTSQHGGGDAVDVTLIIGAARLTVSTAAVSFAATAGGGKPVGAFSSSRTRAPAFSDLSAINVGPVDMALEQLAGREPLRRQPPLQPRPASQPHLPGDGAGDCYCPVGWAWLWR